MFVRKDPFKGRRRKQMKEDTILEMEDYCSILLYARYVREVDGDMSNHQQQNTYILNLEMI